MLRTRRTKKARRIRLRNRRKSESSSRRMNWGHLRLRRTSSRLSMKMNQRRRKTSRRRSTTINRTSQSGQAHELRSLPADCEKSCVPSGSQDVANQLQTFDTLAQTFADQTRRLNVGRSDGFPCRPNPVRRHSSDEFLIQSVSPCLDSVPPITFTLTGHVPLCHLFDVLSV